MTAAAPDAAIPAGFADPDWLVQRRGTVNDASCLNRTAVYGVAQPADEAELGKALAFAREHDVPLNPLHEQGFLSIGCQPCTNLPVPGNDPRSGRWSGRAKTECGLHT